jgi:hypothetical protein
MVKSARTIKYAYKKLNKKYNLAFKHAIEPVRKSFIEENFNQLEEDLIKTTVTPFRNVNNIYRIIMPIYDNSKNRNTIVLNWRTGTKRIVYNNQKDNVFIRLMHLFIWGFATVLNIIKYDCYDKQFKLKYYIKKYQPTLFAINDFSPNKSTFNATIDLIEKMFPNKSEFEK